MKSTLCLVDRCILRPLFRILAPPPLLSRHKRQGCCISIGLSSAHNRLIMTVYLSFVGVAWAGPGWVGHPQELQEPKISYTMARHRLCMNPIKSCGSIKRSHWSRCMHLFSHIYDLWCLLMELYGYVGHFLHGEPVNKLISTLMLSPTFH